VKYMLLMYGETAREDDTMLREIAESGEWVDGAPLADPALARTVRVRDGVAGTSDGPYRGADEQLAGYVLVDCEDLDRAVELAARMPGARAAAVEVRPLMDPSGLEM
jgi:hypothetical protein